MLALWDLFQGLPLQICKPVCIYWATDRLCRGQYDLKLWDYYVLGLCGRVVQCGQRTNNGWFTDSILCTQQCQHTASLQTLSVLLNIESGQLWMFGICWYCLTNNYYSHQATFNVIVWSEIHHKGDGDERWEKSNYFWLIVIFATWPFYAALVSTNLGSKARAQRFAAGGRFVKIFHLQETSLHSSAEVD